MSATHSRSGASGAKLRPTRSRARSAVRSAIVVRLTLPRTAPPSPSSAHQPLHGAARHRDAFAVQLQPHLPGAVDAEVRRRGPGAISVCSSSSRTSARGRRPGRGARSRSTGRSCTPCSVSTAQIDSTPHRRPPRSRWPWWSRMNATITAVAGRVRPRRKPTPPSGWRWPASARRSPACSRFSLRRLLGRRPRPRTAIDLGLTDPLADRLRASRPPAARAPRVIAAHSDSCSSRISATIRTARSFSSGGYLLTCSLT